MFFFRSKKIINIQRLVRFCALSRIKPDAPPLVQTSVNSFEFQSCERTLQVECLRVNLYIEKNINFYKIIEKNY